MTTPQTHPQTLAPPIHFTHSLPVQLAALEATPTILAIKEEEEAAATTQIHRPPYYLSDLPAT